MMEKEKVLGYVLLLAGVILIIFTAINIYQVFTNRVQPVDLFAFDSISLDFTKLLDGPPPPGANLEQELVNSELLNKPMNLFAHLLLMGFLGSVGVKLATIGAMLVRPIKVSLREEKAS